jgi:hydroxymethylbilane synthase
MSQTTIRLGTRGSALALWQTDWAIAKLREVAPDLTFERVVIKTTGDQRQDLPLPAVGAQGMFVKELELALEDGQIDLAVHSTKDLPSVLHPGLVLGAFLPREDVHDALISLKWKALSELPDGARIGTGSFRRQSQLKAYNPTWQFSEIRGNLDTRLKKLETEDLDAIVLAAAGLRRLGWGDRITQAIPLNVCLPAVGQGAVGLEIRAGDDRMRDILAKVDDAQTRAAVLAERGFLRTVQGGCQAPVGAYAFLIGDQLILEGLVAAMDGTKVLRRSMEGPMAKPDELGVALAEELLGMGARELLAKTRLP